MQSSSVFLEHVGRVPPQRSLARIHYTLFQYTVLTWLTTTVLSVAYLTFQLCTIKLRQI